MEAQCKQVTRIEKYVGKGLNDYDTTLFARVDEIFNELEVQRHSLKGHDKLLRKKVVGLIVDVKAMMEEFQAKIYLP